ncbi:hypothetical protein A6F68_00258 [Tsuneonella dongtanensis]|uniref:Terminase small subunit n=1 Tax=Tsuneonella dongtanensis TaxID=692370 RepID=A0A1B2A9E0_9SPHN|nr:hypothetical protein [Tsuneonella dongtanensis]ANY18793.1 hypothetical protein A6F68_00258 [Tsuneonella dongtanensis]
MTEGKGSPRPWEQAFLDAVRAGETQVGAAQIAGIHRTTVRDLAKRDPRFAAELAFARSTPRKAKSDAPPPPVKMDFKLERFLTLLSETSNVSSSASEANLTTATVYARRRSDPVFAQKWFEALAEGYDRLEMDLLERLRTGRLEDVDADGNRRKFDVSAAFRCIAAHREAVAREKGRKKLADELVTMKAINEKIDEMRRKEENAIARKAARDGVIVVRDDG